jgi:mono/diheme cytochrome c family protein
MRKCFSAFVIAQFVLASHAALAEDQAQIDAGAEIYQSKCAECHGERLVNTGAAFDLRKLHADERPRFNKSVTEGKGQMPSWQGMLTDEEMDELWAYIRSKADD